MHLSLVQWCLREGAVRILDNIKLLDLFDVDELAAETSLWSSMKVLEPLLVQEPSRCVNCSETHSALGKWEANDFNLS